MEPTVSVRGEANLIALLTLLLYWLAHIHTTLRSTGRPRPLVLLTLQTFAAQYKKSLADTRCTTTRLQQLGAKAGRQVFKQLVEKHAFLPTPFHKASRVCSTTWTPLTERNRS